MITARVVLSIFIAIILSVLPGPVPAAGEVDVQVVLEKHEVFVGESFRLQIQVDGDDSPAEPDLSGLTDFDVRSLGGQQNSSSSITIINGKMDKVTHQGYIFNYSLTPKLEGVLKIPSIRISAGGVDHHSQPGVVRVKKPVETEDFKLRIALSSHECYIGEPVVLTFTWYIGKDVEGILFNLPMLNDPRFEAAGQPVDFVAGDGKNLVRIPFGSSEIIARRGRGRLKGRDFMTVTFQEALIPKQVGMITLPQATVACKALVGYKESRRQDLFGRFSRDSFFDDFFNRGQRGIYKTVITPSNEPEIKVSALPEKGRPANFTGLVGKYSLAADAVPTEVNVGDPITLTIMVTGPEYLKNVELPPFKDQPGMTGNFKIPKEMATGEIKDRVKVFTQTVRANHQDVKEIPKIGLPYFNTETGKYEVARSDAIPLSVKGARVVTAMDAEGNEVTPRKNEISTQNEGIAYNYDDPGVLETYRDDNTLWITSRLCMAALIVPPACYLIVLVSMVVIRNRRKDPEGFIARRAFSEFSRDIKTIDTGPTADASEAHNRISEALREYLGKRLRLTAGAITYQDVAELLTKSGVTPDAVTSLKHILDQCEAHRFAGNTVTPGDLSNLLACALETAGRIEDHLK